MPIENNFTSAVQFYEEGDYFNASVLFEEEVISGKHKLISLGYLSNLYNSIGLHKKAMYFANEAIQLIEKYKITESNLLKSQSYANRAELFRLMKNYKYMELDLQKSYELYHPNTTCLLVNAKYQLQNNNIKSTLNLLNTAIQQSDNIGQIYYFLGNYYLNINDCDSAMLNFKRALSEDIVNFDSLFYLKTLYKLVDKNHLLIPSLREYHFSSTKSISRFFFKEWSSIGIVQNFDLEKMEGVIIGNSYFSNFDKIPFQLTQNNSPLTTGTIVSFKIFYGDYNGHYSPQAENISPLCVSHEASENNVVHKCNAILIRKDSFFNSEGDLSYAYLYHPFNILLPFTPVYEKLSISECEEIKNSSYAFIEIEIHLIDNKILVKNAQLSEVRNRDSEKKDINRNSLFEDDYKYEKGSYCSACMERPCMCSDPW